VRAFERRALHLYGRPGATGIGKPASA